MSDQTLITAATSRNQNRLTEVVGYKLRHPSSICSTKSVLWFSDAVALRVRRPLTSKSTGVVQHVRVIIKWNGARQ